MAEGTIEVAPLLGTSYAVALRHGEASVWDNEKVPGSDEDRTRWTASRLRFEKDVAGAKAVLDTPIERPWWRRGRRLAEVSWLPGYEAERQALAAQYAEHKALLARAEQRYQPVHEEILARVKKVRRARHRVAGKERARRDRPAAVARREVWCWVRRSESVAEVFRHDVAKDPSLLADSGVKERGPSSLHQVGDELYEYGMRIVSWHEATKQAVVDDCAEVGLPLTFDEWWAAAGPWKKPHRGPTAWCTNRPKWPVPTPRSRERLERKAGGHHSSYGVGQSGFGPHF